MMARAKAAAMAASLVPYFHRHHHGLNPAKWLDSQEHGQRVIRTLGVDTVLVIRTNNSLNDFPTGCGSAGAQTECQIHTYPAVSHVGLTTDTAVASDVVAFLEAK